MGKLLTQKEFIERSKAIHGDKYLYNQAIYKNGRTKVKIYCITHGRFFYQIAKDHMRGKGCQECGHLTRNRSTSGSTLKFIYDAVRVHGKKYDYSRVKYRRSSSKVEILCPSHGSFRQTARDHTYGHGCPKCQESRGERAVRFYLEGENIDFRQEHSFKSCRYKGILRFDFFIPDYKGKKVLIEFQGVQHYRPIEKFGGKLGFIKRLKRDAIKRRFALKNNFELIEIPYTRIKTIKKYLNKRFSIL